MTGVRRFAAISVIVTVAAVALGGASSVAGTKADPNYAPLTAAERHEIASVKPATLAAIGDGGKAADMNPPRIDRWHKLTSGGKPEFAMIVADFCPFCAATDWSVAESLSRFGKLHGLTTITSSPTDIDPSTKSVSFRHVKYRSKYFALKAIVNEGVKNQPLQPVPPNLKRVWKHYDKEPSYPFLDFANKVVVLGPSYDPQVLAGLSRVAIAKQLNDKTSPVATAIDGSANQLTAAICAITKNKPKRVCGTKTIATIERHLK